MKIFVGNLPFSATADDVKHLFEGFGTVLSVTIVEDSDRESRGFGFVDMSADGQAYAAIEALDGKDFMGRVINVSPAKAKPVITGSRHGEGRRSRNFLKRHEEPGQRDEQKPERTPWHPAGGNRQRPWERDQAGRTSSGKTKPWGSGQSKEKRWKYGEKSQQWEARSKEQRPWEREQAGRPSSGKPKPWGPGQSKEKRRKYGEKSQQWEARSKDQRPWERERGEFSGRPWRKPQAHSRSKPWESREKEEYGGGRPRREHPFQSRPKHQGKSPAQWKHQLKRRKQTRERERFVK